VAQRGTEFGKSGDAQETPAGDQPVIPEQRVAPEPSTAPVRRGSVLGYLAEVEPLMEPTGGYPMIVRRQPTSASAPTTPPPRTPTAPPPAGSTVVDEPAQPARRRRLWPLVLVLVVVIVALAALLLAVARRQSTGSVSLPPPSGVAAIPSATASPAQAAVQPRVDDSGTQQPALGGTGSSAPADQPSASASASASSAPATPPPALTARYETVRNTGVLGLTGYRGQITVTNPGSLSVGGWTVTLVLPSGQQVAAAAGADYRQDGATVTFTPTADTLNVPATGSVSFTFDVGALLGGPPVACAVNEQPCD
jgi:Cellulose binding domain